MFYKLLWRALNIAFIANLFACQGKNETSEINLKSNSNIKLKYAKHFEIKNLKKEFEINVINPWQFAKNEQFKYSFNSLKKPINRVICLSTSHIGFMSKLNLQNKIVGVSGINLINDSITNNLIKNKKIIDVGYDQNLNYELILSLKPDIIIAYSVESKNVGYITKLKELGINVIFVAEYLEETPLAKAEWIKFFGVIFNQYQKSDSLFNIIESEYNITKKIAENYKEKPTVFAGLPWKDSWFIAGGKSNLANLIKDAGALYIWNTDTSTQSFPLNLESVLNKAINADFWLNSGSANSLNDIYLTDSRLNNFKAFKTKNIYNNNSKCNTFGGNDYWESGIVNPQIVLKDIIKIIHPQLFPNYKTVYFKRLN